MNNWKEKKKKVKTINKGGEGEEGQPASSYLEGFVDEPYPFAAPLPPYGLPHPASFLLQSITTAAPAGTQRING